MNASDVVQLQEPLTAGGIRSVNFFNGRLLSSKDLTREQLARREADWRLGLALGGGVAFGLDVERETVLSKDTAPVLRIRSGLAVNRAGQTLRLGADTCVALTRSFDAAAVECVFVDCEKIPGGTYVRGAGAYVLTLAPAERSEGRAPTNGLDPQNVRCNTDAMVEGIQFRLHGVNLAPFASALGQPFLRNALAYGCFGDDVKSGWFAGLLDALPRRAGVLDELRKTSLTDYDVPLALLYVTGAAKLEFIDQWAVRRALHRPSSSVWGSLVEGERLAVGQAMFLQFQRHVLDDAPPTGDLRPLTARTHFRYLPPVGILPVLEESDKTDAAAARFFTGMAYRGPTFINAERLESLVRESLCYPPIDTHGAEMVWLYRVRENRMAIEFRGGEPGPRSYVVFASGHLPYRGSAQFDLGYWDYANYAVNSQA